MATSYHYLLTDDLKYWQLTILETKKRKNEFDLSVSKEAQTLVVVWSLKKNNWCSLREPVKWDLTNDQPESRNFRRVL